MPQTADLRRIPDRSLSGRESDSLIGRKMIPQPRLGGIPGTGPPACRWNCPQFGAQKDVPSQCEAEVNGPLD